MFDTQMRTSSFSLFFLRSLARFKQHPKIFLTCDLPVLLFCFNPASCLNMACLIRIVQEKGTGFERKERKREVEITNLRN